MKTIELLAPAKNLECGMAAIVCGADAVYIGGPKFGARTAAGNDLADIHRLVQFAHKYWAKVYVTINTLLKDSELEQVQQLIEGVWRTGADAVIIQDMGILEIDLPPIPLIASTQAHNDTWPKVQFLERVGFSRVILARELTIDEIREIRDKVAKIELECFVHGALCVSYSGQCYLSYAWGGRSGNRGECAQPCRKLYSLCDAHGKVLCRDKHLLSLKDLNYSEHLRELLGAGITSFKIEGRLKDITYLKNTVSFYRRNLDAILEERGWQKSSSGQSKWDFTPDLSKTFNRGYSDYFLHGRKPDIASSDTPKLRGESLGRVSHFDGRSFANPSQRLHSGDGISFFHQGMLTGTLVEVREDRVYPNHAAGIGNGVEIFRNLDHEFLKRLDKAEIERNIRVRLAFREQNGELCLCAVDEDRVEAAVAIHCEREVARNPAVALANIQRQLLKLGDTEFEAAQVEVDLPVVYFIALRVLNEARRAVMAQLAQNRLARYKENQRHPPLLKNDFPYPEESLTPYHNVMNKLAERFYRRHRVREIQPALEGESRLDGQKVMTTRHCIKYMLRLCPKEGFRGRLAEPLYLVDEEGRKLLLQFNCPACKMEVVMPHR